MEDAKTSAQCVVAKTHLTTLSKAIDDLFSDLANARVELAKEHCKSVEILDRWSDRLQQVFVRCWRILRTIPDIDVADQSYDAPEFAAAVATQVDEPTESAMQGLSATRDESRDQDGTDVPWTSMGDLVKAIPDWIHRLSVPDLHQDNSEAEVSAAIANALSAFAEVIDEAIRRTDSYRERLKAALSEKREISTQLQKSLRTISDLIGKAAVAGDANQ